MPRLKTPLTTPLGPLSLSTPLMNASGCFWPDTFDQLFSIEATLGMVVSKTLKPQAQPGNVQQRTVEIPGVGMLNSIGLQGKGLPTFLETDLAPMAAYGSPVMVSIAGNDAEQFAAMARALAQHAHQIAAVEVNLSCPNVKEGGADQGTNTQWIREVVTAVAENAGDYPLFAKVTPNTHSTLPLAEAALSAGATGITAINTVLGLHIDVGRKRPSLARVSGGYSGPGIKPIALHHCYQLAKTFPGVPLIGVGGIQTVNDALEFFMAGCNALQMGTACFKDPLRFQQIVEGLEAYLQREGCQSITELIGCAQAK